jgi:hypothetical protein
MQSGLVGITEPNSHAATSYPNGDRDWSNGRATCPRPSSAIGPAQAGHEALRIHQQVLVHRMTILGPDHPNTLISANGHALTAAGEPEVPPLCRRLGCLDSSGLGGMLAVFLSILLDGVGLLVLIR